MASGAGTLRIEYAWGSRTRTSLGATQRANPGCRRRRADSSPSSDRSKTCACPLFGVQPSGGKEAAILVPSKGENHFETDKRSLSVLIRIGYEIVLRLFNASPVVFLLRVHPSRRSLLVAPEDFHIEPDLPVQYYRDSFGNHCGRLSAPPARIRFRNHAVVRDSGEPDVFAPEAEEEIVCRM